eukprot:m.66463 g.66463  ORF g.66463 m.66463 type:complete len:663 (-) comp11554_c0_seq1:195-2183(-)
MSFVVLFLLVCVVVRVSSLLHSDGGAVSPEPGLLKRNDSYQLSYEGSWSYVAVDPQESPSSMGSLGYRLYSDWSPGEPLFNDLLSVSTNTIESSPSNDDNDDSPKKECSLIDYMWRPDYTNMTAQCLGVHVTTTTWYQNDRQVCTSIALSARYDQIVFFTGTVPRDGKAVASNITQVGLHDTYIETSITSDRDPYHESFSVTWLLQMSLDQQAAISSSGDQYSWYLTMMGGTQNEISFCVTELKHPVKQPQPLPFPALNLSATTDAVQAWLDEAAPLPTSTSHASTVTYYTAWYQFWFNTEREGGNWIKPVITPSMSHYGRGMWLWDTGFHVFALLSGKDRALQKAKDQLEVLLGSGLKVGHIPRVVGVNTTENTTQPPGILTWAALLIYNRTEDKSFLQSALKGFGENNHWFYTAHASSNPLLCMWEGTDSGWDNSPRWDLGNVEAIDLNSWLYMDQVLLSKMAFILGNKEAEASWTSLAQRTKKAVTEYLWDSDSSMFWDRLPHPLNTSQPFHKVVTPAPFWSLLSSIASQPQAQTLTDTLLTADNLKTPFFMPCVGRSEPQFNPTDYWRGPVWINVNWLVSVGLECYGLDTVSKSLRDESIALVNSSPTPREYYNPLTEGGLGAFNFMWTGAIYIVMQQQKLGGFDPSLPLHDYLGCSS